MQSRREVGPARILQGDQELKAVTALIPGASSRAAAPFHCSASIAPTVSTFRLRHI
jgi:hypothetical protein